MTNPLLYAATAALPVLALAGLVLHLWRRRYARPLTVTEWCEAMRKLEPSTPPKFRTKHVRTGAPGVSFPEPKRGKLAVVKAKTGTRGRE
ncbi:MAG: hypothetical protein WCA44_05985 [Acidobacteriaceae bacterium]